MPTIRPATPDDVPAILALIRELAEYEKLSHAVVATEDLLREHLFGAPPARVNGRGEEWAHDAPRTHAAGRGTGTGGTPVPPPQTGGMPVPPDNPFPSPPPPGREPAAEALVAEVPGETHPVAFALFFRSFSTFLARPGIYLEDIYVRPAFRGRGIGRALLSAVARLAVDRGCGRLEWSVLDWNEPAIGFYKRLGAEPMDEWTVFRLTGEALQAAAKR